MVRPVGGFVYWLPILLAFLAGYLSGSVPWGVVLARLAGATDPRAVGSGNIGATNVLRTGRRGLAAATLLLDLLKGFLPVWAAWTWTGPDTALAAGAGAVIGHCFPIWLRFRGGKGVATATGVVLALTPVVLLPASAIFALAFALTRYVSLGSMSAALAVPLAAYLWGHVQAAELYLFVALLVLFQHRANIARLLQGREPKTFLRRKAEP
ncbi:MAG: glycerol-3-phosphate 1-O-acyltransferase PlsY [Geminicoccaceae bacterium]|nr:glycerol-3-phosphate 1-O-acyltransferase PlsY [Geminicoccaceae bacterium]MCS7266782.1 glycerol-3-phosphate 1-O-acyltransferase PlsY [Geminicoccaceae bacterium]MCX7630521.1 glycerol-3-phosphate 1-O-acyltransferase PlsY [Geminicoccaceae bacterium]MDW8123803.1 glycerol-3-phosphate 1-O-acyltransferase PlsY [Geminicoccaceae bacterium]MDW8341599.1 glycerol-3-phosphate 1-O-acyltransferase PlsY [Geminicoccaceae bacterium]